MRDLLIAAIVFSCVPLALFRPDFGICAYAWIGLMNPHRLSWRLETAPVGMIMAAATLIGTVVRGKLRPIPMNGTTALLLLFALYTTLTTMTALSSDAWIEWNRFVRILLMSFVAIMVLRERVQLERFVWVCMASIGFYGLKGGVFSIVTRGQYRVWGPRDSFIEGNNELALAELMVLPLFLYFARQAGKGWQRWAYYGAFTLTLFSILFSYSRGAFVGFAALALLMAARSKFRIQAFFMIVVLGGLMAAFVPTQWRERMFTITEYKADESAMGRINAWHFAYNVAKDRIFGGGFRTFTRELFATYAPDPTGYHDAHSIYFEVLGEQGFPGLAIYLGILLGSLWRLERLRRAGRKDPSRTWVRELAEMLQFSIIAYMLGGAFLGLAYFDLFYYLVVSALLLESIAARQTAAARAAAPVPVPATAPALRSRPHGA